MAKSRPVPHATIATTLGQLAAAERGLASIGELDLRGKALYHAAKLQRLAGADLAIFTEKKLAIIKELGEQKGDLYTVKPEHLDVWRERLGELAAIDVTIAWAPLKLSDLGDVALKSNDLNALLAAGLIVEDEG